MMTWYTKLEWINLYVQASSFCFCSTVDLCWMLQLKPQLVKEVRETLLSHLTAVLGNDSLAAHLVLLHLLSRVCILFFANFAYLSLVLKYFSLCCSLMLKSLASLVSFLKSDMEKAIKRFSKSRYMPESTILELESSLWISLALTKKVYLSSAITLCWQSRTSYLSHTLFPWRLIILMLLHLHPKRIMKQIGIRCLLCCSWVLMVSNHGSWESVFTLDMVDTADWWPGWCSYLRAHI